MKPVDPRLLRRASPVRSFLAALAGIGVADALLVVVQATLLADLVTRLVLQPRSQAPFGSAVAGLIAVSVGRAVLVWAREGFAVRTSTTVKATLRGDLIKSLISGPARAADRERFGEPAVLATRGIDALDGYFARYLPQLALAAIVPAVLGARILAADPLSALIIALTIALIPLFMVLVGLMTRDLLARRWAALERLGGHFLEVVAGLATLVAFGRAKAQREVIRRAADAHRRATAATLRVAFLSSLVLELIAMLSVALVAVAIGLRLADGTLALRTGLIVLICAPEVYLPLRLVGARYHDAAEGLAATERIFAVAQPGPVPVGACEPAFGPSASDVIRFEGVRVSRTGRATQQVHDVELPLIAGRTTALVGPSGIGKSTILHLILGFDTPSTGRVTFRGMDFAQLDADQWRARVAWVPQRPRLTGRTVADAIRLGRAEAAHGEVARAAKAAGIDFALDTPLGRDGTALSGGQARRVALARAILRDAPIVLLDEPTEHLDPETESVITDALRAWLPGRTALLITHRPALLELCDNVIRLEADAPLAPAISCSPIEGAAVSAHSARDAVPEPEKTDRRRIRTRILSAIGLGSAAALCNVGLAASSAWLIATAALRPPLLTLQVGIAAVQAFGIGRASLRYAERLAGHDATLRLLADVRVRVYRGLLRRAPAGMAAERGGDLLTNLTADIDAAQDLFLKVLLPAVAAALSCAGLLLFEVFVLPASAAVLCAGVITAAVLAPLLTRAADRGAERRTATVHAELAEHTVNLLGALPDLVAYGAAAQYAGQIAATDRRLTVLAKRGALASGLGMALGALTAGTTCAALAAVTIAAAHSGRIAGPVAAALVLAPLALFESLAVLPDAARAYDRGRAAWVRLRRIADAAPLVSAPQPPTPVVWSSTSVLEFDRVTAQWPDPERNDAASPTPDEAVARTAVSDISLRVRAGESVELIGPSGVGKSTIAALASRCLDPASGAVRIDGVDLRDADPDQVRRLIVVCGQDAHLFDSSIRQNLLIARPEATDDELWRALTAVRLEAWVRDLPAGLNTRVGQLGDAVSGGERQRIALARVLLSRAPVVILDEPLAHLDAETAAAVERNLRRALDGRAVVWIRHAACHRGQQSRDIRVFGLSPSGCTERHDAAEAVVPAA
ncbi:MAG TPA: thiol reductant ABC exporter subunit CydD [Actinocrinis sp.]|nr:thiol reductant ABC exporter subunit CydD [Actinocrinis sp.]